MFHIARQTVWETRSSLSTAIRAALSLARQEINWPKPRGNVIISDPPSQEGRSRRGRQTTGMGVTFKCEDFSFSQACFIRWKSLHTYLQICEKLHVELGLYTKLVQHLQTSIQYNCHSGCNSCIFKQRPQTHVAVNKDIQKADQSLVSYCE